MIPGDGTKKIKTIIFGHWLHESLDVRLLAFWIGPQRGKGKLRNH